MSPEGAYLLTFAMIIFMKIVCFVLGYLTIRLGYHLIASGVKGEFKFSAKLGGLKADLASVSPGEASLEKGRLTPGKKVEKPAPRIPPSPFDSLKKTPMNNLEETSDVHKHTP